MTMQTEMRERQINIRLSEDEATRLDRVTSHYGLNVANLFRMLIKREADTIAKDDEPRVERLEDEDPELYRRVCAAWAKRCERAGTGHWQPNRSETTIDLMGRITLSAAGGKYKAYYRKDGDKLFYVEKR